MRFVSSSLLPLAGGFGPASRHATIPKTTLSRHVRQLEDELAVRLIERTSNAFRLTPEGERLRDQAAPLLVELEDMGECLRSAGGEPRGPLRINAPILLAYAALGKLAAQYRARYPLVQLEIVGEDRYVDIIGDRYDAVIRANPKPDTDYVGRCFLRERLILVGAEEIADPKNPGSIPFVALSGQKQDGGLAIARANRTVTLEIETVLELSSQLMIRDAVLAGAGFGVLPASMVRGDRLCQVGGRSLPV